MSLQSRLIARRKAFPWKARNSGFALVVVLALLVLILVAVLAYFSRTSLQRQISSSSAANAEVELLAQSAMATVLEDFATEIEAGSSPEDASFVEAEVRVKRPRWVLDAGLGRYVSPSMVPQRAGDGGIPAIVKASRRETPFFTIKPGYASPAGGPTQGITRASNVSTETPSRNGRRMDKQRWNVARFLTNDESTTFAVPDWIYVSRDGSNPTDLDSGTLPALRDNSPGNDQAVIGRFAYVVYDTGGLIDINVVGNGLDAAENAERGRLHQVSLAEGIGDVALPNFTQFVTWRWPNSASNKDRENGGLFDPKRTFIDVASGEQTFVTRQDLINYVSQPNSPIPETALPYLTAHNRDVNAPDHAPDPSIPAIPSAYFESGDTSQLELNPDLLGPTVRFAEEVVLARPEGALKVPAGTPVMLRRFPLGKLDLLSQDNPDPDELMYYFGLVKQPDGRLLYDTARIGGRLASLEKVAAYRDGTIADPDGTGAMLPKAREPNFFEVLQAVLAAGSLGKSGSSPEFTAKLMGLTGLSFNNHNQDNTAILAHQSDRLRFRQVLQIGANIIDQWDKDDFPTTILYPSGVPDQYIESYGVENLPYITQMSVTPYRPNYAVDGAAPRECLQVWGMFDVWNPHQNAAVPTDIDEFRVVCVRGKATTNVLLYVSDTILPNDDSGVTSFISNDGIKPGVSASFPASVDTTPDGGTKHMQRLLAGYSPEGSPIPGSSVKESIKDLNENFDLELKFPPASYTEPVTIGSGEPKSATDVPGILLAHRNFNKVAIESVNLTRPNPAIPAKAERSKSMQRTLNHWYDIQKLFPYRVWQGSGGSEIPVRVFDSGDLYSRCVAPAYETEGSGGERIYPPDSVFEFPGDSANYWSVDPPLVYSGSSTTSNPTTGNTTVYAKIGVKAHNYVRVSPQQNDPLVFDLQARINGQWVTYQRLEGLYPQGYTFYHDAVRKDTLLENTHHSAGGVLGGFYQWMGVSVARVKGAGTYSKIDPRSPRFGLTETSQNIMGYSPRTTSSTWNGVWTDSTPSKWTTGSKDYSLGRNLIRSDAPPSYMPSPNAPGFENFWSADTAAYYGLVANNPDLLDAEHPMRYADIDGVIRPADGYWGAIPTIPSRLEDRPVVLNRPFRSVGELGYVFRDTPWKTLDMATSASGDLGLLDVFSLDESTDDPPLVAGKVNLNTARAEVISALLRGSLKQGAAKIDSTLAEELGVAIAEEARKAPFRTRGEIVTRVLGRTGTDDLLGDTRKTEREAAVRALAETGSTRTWNFLIDLVVQSGRFAVSAVEGKDFLVQAEQRYWVHVTIDRMTGEAVDVLWEKVKE